MNWKMLRFCFQATGDIKRQSENIQGTSEEVSNVRAQTKRGPRGLGKLC